MRCCCGQVAFSDSDLETVAQLWNWEEGNLVLAADLPVKPRDEVMEEDAKLHPC